MALSQLVILFLLYLFDDVAKANVNRGIEWQKRPAVMDHCTGPSHFLLSSILLSCVCGVSFGTELSFVTCGSVVKLLNIKHNVRLHSHDVRYGSGECNAFSLLVLLSTSSCHSQLLSLSLSVFIFS